MRQFLLTIFCCLLLSCAGLQTNLQTTNQNDKPQFDEGFLGTWQLKELIVAEQLMSIDTSKYYLKITPKGFSYNLEVNTCWLQGWEFNDNELTTESIPCTRVCCDDRYGRTYEYLNYTGTYQLDETHKRLTILGSNGITKLVLVRTEKTTW